MYIMAVLNFLYSTILPFVILLGILIFVHELGHFLVARMCGVRVEVFSLGFGKKIFSYKKGDTTYCISLIPLGGFVKMFGEQSGEAGKNSGAVVMSEADKKVSFSHKTPWQRIAIVLAGPLMNFFFAIFVFSLIAEMGEQSRSAVVAAVAVSSPADQMGLKAGDRILEVNSVQIKSYEEFQNALNQFKNTQVPALVQSVDGTQKNLTLNVSDIENPNIFSLESRLGHIEGLLPYATSAVVAVMTDTPAYQAGFRTGDEIVEISAQNANAQKIASWAQLSSFFNELILRLNKNAKAVDKKNATESITFKIIRPVESLTVPSQASSAQGSGEGSVAETNLTLIVSYEQIKKIKSLSDFGFDSTELYLDQIVKDSPAAAADLRKYDKIIAINSRPISKWEDISETVKSFDGKEAMTFVISRDGAEIIKKITPKVTELTTAFGGVEKRFTIGITPYIMMAMPELTIVKSESIFHSLQKGTRRTIDISVMTVMSFVKLFQGEVSVKNVGGMVSIGKAAKDSFSMGAQAFLMTMGILSVSLFILNLLPIPVLDGGHLIFYTVELIKGSPLSIKKMEVAQQIGFILLLALMILAQYNDIVKFLFKS